MITIVKRKPEGTFATLSALPEVEVLRIGTFEGVVMPRFTMIEKEGDLYFRLPTNEETINSSLTGDEPEAFIPMFVSHRLIHPQTKYFHSGRCFIHPDLVSHIKKTFKMNGQFNQQIAINMCVNYVNFVKSDETLNYREVKPNEN